MYRRVLLKLSGESLGGKAGKGFRLPSSMEEATYSEASRDWTRVSTEWTGIAWECSPQ